MKALGRFTAIIGSCAAVAVLMLWPITASADPMPLTYNDDLKDIQQTENAPCVIGSPSCDNSLPFTVVSGGPGNKTETSPTYMVSDLTAAVGSQSMYLLVDVNQACGQGGTGGEEGCPIQVDLIQVVIEGIVEYEFTGPQPVPLAGSLQGNGYSDAGWQFLDFSGFDPTDSVVFNINWSLQTDGQETFFLAAAEAQGSPPPPPPPPTGVPEASSTLLLGLALAAIGLGALGRKKMKFMKSSS